jgi:hypothetical protein
MGQSRYSFIYENDGTYQNVAFQVTPPQQAHLGQSVDTYQDGDEP